MNLEENDWWEKFRLDYSQILIRKIVNWDFSENSRSLKSPMMTDGENLPEFDKFWHSELLWTLLKLDRKHHQARIIIDETFSLNLPFAAGDAYAWPHDFCWAH